MRWGPGFLALSVIWGSSFALIKVAVDADVPPVWVALARCLFGALALWSVCLVQRAAVPRDRSTWGHAFVVGLLLNAAPSALYAYGETHVTSVLAGVLNATTPLTTLLFVTALVAPERPSRRSVAGLGLGFGGVLVTVRIWEGLAGSGLAGTLACLGAAVCLGAGFAYTRRFFSGRPGSAAALTGIQLTCATVQLAAATAATGAPPGHPGSAAIIALVTLGALGTGFAFLLNLRLIRTAGPTIASCVTYLVPLWSTLIGALLLGEPLGWSLVAGGLLVILGVFLVQSPPRRSPVPARTTPPLPAVPDGR